MITRMLGPGPRCFTSLAFPFSFGKPAAGELVSATNIMRSKLPYLFSSHGWVPYQSCMNVQTLVKFSSAVPSAIAKMSD